MKEAVNDMRETIIELENKLKFKEELSFNGKVFEYEKDGKKLYVCNGCEPKGIYSHMTEKHNNGSHIVNCPVCKNKVTLVEGTITVRTRR